MITNLLRNTIYAGMMGGGGSSGGTSNLPSIYPFMSKNIKIYAIVQSGKIKNYSSKTLFGLGSTMKL